MDTGYQTIQPESRGFYKEARFVMSLKELPLSVRVVFWVICDLSAKWGTCWAEKWLIEQRAGLSESSVKQALRTLKKIGFISVEREGNRIYREPKRLENLKRAWESHRKRKGGQNLTPLCDSAT